MHIIKIFLYSRLFFCIVGYGDRARAVVGCGSLDVGRAVVGVVVVATVKRGRRTWAHRRPRRRCTVMMTVFRHDAGTGLKRSVRRRWKMSSD
jgi:ribosomal protein L2